MKPRNNEQNHTSTIARHARQDGRCGLISFLALLLTVGFATAAQGQATTLFFSEYVEGSNYNKALEIYNGTGATVDLAADGYEVEIYFNGSNSAGVTIALTGAVADGDVYVVADDDADAAILAEADQVPTSPFFNGNDAVVLVKNGSTIDVIGQVGVNPGEWGSGDESTQDNTLRRKESVCAGDPDGSDAFDPTLEWLGFPQDTFGGLGSHRAICVDLQALLERVEQLEAEVDALRDHTHIYLTGRGRGHNNTEATTDVPEVEE